MTTKAQRFAWLIKALGYKPRLWFEKGRWWVQL